MKLETLPVGPGVEPPTFRVDCIPSETAELNPRVCGYQEVGKMANRGMGSWRLSANKEMKMIPL